MSGNYFQPIKREFLNLSGGTVTGDTVFTQGLYARILSGGAIYSGSTNLYDIFSQTDYYTTGSTFNPTTKIATFDRNDGNTYALNLSALTTADTYITGFTYSPNVITIKQNENQPDLQVIISSFSGISISGITNNQIELNYNPTASTESTSLGSGVLIQDGSGIAGTDVFFDIRGTGSTVSSRGFATNLHNIYLRESGTINSPNGVRVIAEFDELDGGQY